MGSFFTNVQVSVKEITTQQASASIIEAIRDLMSSKGYVEVDDERVATRKIKIAFKTADLWMSVYDEGTEMQHADILDELSATLSTTCDKIAISILVHDGDLLEVAIFRNGTKKSQITNWPGYFEGSLPSTEPIFKGEGPDKLKDLLVNDQAVSMLYDTGQTGGSAEEAIVILKKMSGLFGWDSELSTLGFNTLPAMIYDESAKLLFRSLSPGTLSRLPSAFGHSGGEGPGSPIHACDPINFTMIAHSTGGESKGMIITLWGQALDRGLIDPENGIILLGPLEAGVLREFTLQKAVGTSGQLRTITLTDFQIPKGITDPSAAFKDSEGHFERGMNAWLATRIEIRVQTIALVAGAGDLHIGLVPVENADNGSASWTFDFQVTG
jgi:hypothetical protein